jgi:cobalt-zinc-cadmium efflux system protein
VLADPEAPTQPIEVVSHDHHHTEGSRNIGVAFLLNFAFTILEIVGGLWTNSIAILTDALHDFGDCLSLGAAWYLQKLSRRSSDATFTYGYRRFSVLGALITGLVLLAGLIFILFKAAGRLLNPETVNASGMIVIAIVGVIFNGLAVLRLKGGTSLNEKVASWHLLEDVLGWVAVLIGSIAMTMWSVPIIDPLLSIGISLFVLWNVVKNLKKVFMVMLQRAPKSFDLKQFQCALDDTPKLLSTHHTHTWSLDGERHVLSTHLVLEPDASRAEIVEAKQNVHAVLRKHNFEHITIDVELQGEECASGANESHANARPAIKS